MIDISIYVVHTFDDILTLLNTFNSVYTSPLSERVGLLDTSAEKLHRYAKVITANNEFGNICGFAAYYKNKPDTKLAYLTQLAVAPEHRKKGIAGLLLNSFESDICTSGFERARLEVNKENTAAINLYKKYGYKIVEVMRHSWYMEKNVVNNNISAHS